MGDNNLKKLNLNDDEIDFLFNLNKNFLFFNSNLNLNIKNIYEKEEITDVIFEEFKSLNTKDSDRFNLIYKIITSLNVINPLTINKERFIFKFDDFFVFDKIFDDNENKYLIKNVRFKTITEMGIEEEEKEMEMAFGTILFNLDRVSNMYVEYIKSMPSSSGGNKKTKKSDKYTVKQLKTMAFVYNVNTTKKSNGKIVNLKSNELLTKLKKSKIIL
jgi:hypothetical protein